MNLTQVNLSFHVAMMKKSLVTTKPLASSHCTSRVMITKSLRYLSSTGQSGVLSASVFDSLLDVQQVYISNNSVSGVDLSPNSPLLTTVHASSNLLSGDLPTNPSLKILSLGSNKYAGTLDGLSMSLVNLEMM
jgi:hypothetical protein